VPAPLMICTDRDAAELRRLARRERDGRVSARLLALANALDGLPREEAARLAGMTGQTLGDWVHRYNVYGRPRPARVFFRHGWHHRFGLLACIRPLTRLDRRRP
jgi:hypothetical protein